MTTVAQVTRRELTKVRARARTGEGTFCGSVQREPSGWTRMLYSDQSYRWPYYHSGTNGAVCVSFSQAFDALIRDIGRIWGVNVERPWLLEEYDL